MKMENGDRILFTEVHGEVEIDVEFPVEFRNGGWKRSSPEASGQFVGGDVVQGSIVEGDLS
jgi:hypothetical protein